MSITYLPSSNLNISGAPLNSCTRSSSYLPGSSTLMLSKSNTTGVSSFAPTRLSTSVSICCFCSGLRSIGSIFLAASSLSFLMKKKSLAPQGHPFRISRAPSW